VRLWFETLTIDCNSVTLKMSGELGITADYAIHTNSALTNQSKALRTRAKSKLGKRARDADFSTVLFARQMIAR
jgi:hypothetical protein